MLRLFLHLTKGLTSDAVNSTEIEALCKAFLETSGGEPVISQSAFKKRMGFVGVTDTTFLDSFFNAFQKHSPKPGVIDIRGFLLGLGTIFKGTVEERMKCKLFKKFFVCENFVVHSCHLILVNHFITS